MNIAKHMEAILVATLAVVSLTGVASAGVRAHQTGVESAPIARVTLHTSVAMNTPAALRAQTVQERGMTVVVVSAKRLSAAEKAAL